MMSLRKQLHNPPLHEFAKRHKIRIFVACLSFIQHPMLLQGIDMRDVAVFEEQKL